MTCEDCKSAKRTAVGVNVAGLGIVSSIAGMLFLELRHVESRMSVHVSTAWHTGAGEGLARLDTRVSHIEAQIGAVDRVVNSKTDDRFRGADWIRERSRIDVELRNFERR